VLTVRTPQRGFTIIEVMISLVVWACCSRWGSGLHRMAADQQIPRSREATLTPAGGVGARNTRCASARLRLELDLRLVGHHSLAGSVSWVVEPGDPTGVCDAVTDSGSPFLPRDDSQRRTSAESHAWPTVQSVRPPGGVHDGRSHVNFAALVRLWKSARGEERAAPVVTASHTPVGFAGPTQLTETGRSE